LFAFFVIPETKGLTLEQVDKMMEESTPRGSAKWRPHDTFAHEMSITEYGSPRMGESKSTTLHSNQTIHEGTLENGDHRLNSL
jgi:hypothetical protein